LPGVLEVSSLSGVWNGDRKTLHSKGLVVDEANSVSSHSLRSCLAALHICHDHA